MLTGGGGKYIVTNYCTIPGGESIDQNSAQHNRPQYEALGNNYRDGGVYSPEPRTEVYCVELNFNIAKLVYSLSR